MKKNNNLLIEQDGSVVKVMIDRPPVNAMSTDMYELLRDTFRELGDRSDVFVVILGSTNRKIFSAGADIRELSGIVSSESSALDEHRQELAREMFDALLNLAQPTIAVVGGVALGAGAVLAACCDIRVGSTNARVGLAEINVARCGGGRHMMRILPQGVVRRMYFTGEPLTATELHRFGVFEDLFEPGEELEAAVELARKISSKSPHALRMAKRALNACEPLSISDGYATEQQYTVTLGRSDDAKEAALAFLEKRLPIWTGS